MSRANLGFVVLLLLIINITLYVGGVRVVDNDTSDFLGRFIDLEEYDENGNLVIADEFQDSVPTSYQNTGGGGILDFIDAIGAIVDFLVFIVNILFTPIGLFVGTGLPTMVGVLVGLPLVVGGVLAFIYFVRSG